MKFPSPPRGPLLAAAVLGAASAAASWLLIGRVELTFDEAYYTLWSRWLAFGYYDHPPMVAAWIRASTEMFGGSESGVRGLGALLFAFAPALIGFSAARLYESTTVGAFAALAWLAMPLSPGALLATPDAPLTFFSIFTLAGLIEVFRGRAAGWGVVAIGLGGALDSKFTALFLGAGVVLALAVTPALRPQFRNPWPYLAAFAAATAFAPFVIWNAEHGFATFVKQFGRVPAHRWSPGYVLEFVGGQWALANPLLVVASAVAWRRGGEASRLLGAYVAPALGYFLIHALHDRVQGNWTAPLFPAFAMLAGQAAANGSLAARRTAMAGFAVGIVAIALIEAHLATGWPALGRADPLARIGGWKALTHQVDSRARAEGAAFIVARGYAATSLLSYYGDGAAPVIQSDERERWIFAPAPVLDPAAPGVAFGESGRGYEGELRAKYRSVVRIGTLDRESAGARVESYELFRVEGAL